MSTKCRLTQKKKQKNSAEVNENCLYYDYYWGCVEVVSPGFATKKECQEYFNTAKEFAFFR